MFSRRSRYFRLPEVVAENSDGRLLRSVALRTPPELGDGFRHTVDADDRLDHLAFKYYRQSLHWWRICDANPQFLSPLAMLGKDPIVTADLAVRWPTPAPDWNAVRQALRQINGIDNVGFGNPQNPVPELILTADETASPGELPLTAIEELSNAVLSQQITPALEAALLALAIDFAGAELRVSQLEQNQQWRIQSLSDFSIYQFVVSASGVVVFPVQQIHDWIIRLNFNRHSAVEDAVVQALEGLGLNVTGTFHMISPIGKTINIPPRFTG